MNIRAQSVGTAAVYRSSESSPTTASAGQAGLAGRDTTPTGPGRSDDASAVFSSHPAEGDRIGTLSIPVLKRDLPIIEGTGADELKRGVGHFAQSVMPGEEDNCVLSGHRDTVFAQLGKVNIGDQLIVETAAGTFTYEVKRIRIVHKDDRTIIVPTDHAVLTVSTCYPFRYVGSAPDRYVVSADLVMPRQP
ncbi:MAG: class D sortase [Coriobacteriaceae bacterium]|nr:class D sortase [Coriobacteriaceae bacterium]